MISLRIKTPITRGTPQFIADISPDPDHPDKRMKAIGWNRSIRSIGGYWQGEFTLKGRIQEMIAFFYNNLACHFEEYSYGFKTWEGLIYEMELVTPGGSRRRSLDDMYNSVQVRWMDPDTDALDITTAATNITSIAQYGTRQIVWPMAGQSQTVAEELRDRILAEAAWPWARPINKKTRKDEEAHLLIRVCGYAFTANWQIESYSDDTQDELSDWIILILQTNCPLLKVGSIARNTFQVAMTNKNYMRAWDQMTKLLDVGLDTVPVRLYVDNDRYVFYAAIDIKPRYFNRSGILYGTSNTIREVDPWSVKPAVVRDSEYPIYFGEQGSWLTDNRDWYMSEVIVRHNKDGTATLDPRAEDYEESDLMTNQQQLKEELRRWREEKRAKKHAE